MANEQEIRHAIMNGVKFNGSSRPKDENGNKVKTKARKKSYFTGAHGSAASKHKAEIRQRVKSRKSQQR